jgi:hypothetical protein
MIQVVQLQVIARVHAVSKINVSLKKSAQLTLKTV